MEQQQCFPEHLQQCPLAHEVADAAVKKTFAILGVDVDRPESVEEFREDLRFGKRMRKAADRGMLAMATVVAGGVVIAIWSGAISHITGR